jgi:hypothetical protein
MEEARRSAPPSNFHFTGDLLSPLRHSRMLHMKWEDNAEKPSAYRADLVIPAIF